MANFSDFFKYYYLLLVFSDFSFLLVTLFYSQISINVSVSLGPVIEIKNSSEGFVYSAGSHITLECLYRYRWYRLRLVQV